MKLKNEQEIEALAKINRENLYRKWTGNMDMEQASDIEDIIIQTYTQAQQDLLASASEDWDEWELDVNWPNAFRDHRSAALEAWQASSLYLAKKMQEKDAEIEALKKKLEIQTKRVENLKKSNEFYSGNEAYEEGSGNSSFSCEWGEVIESESYAIFEDHGMLARSCQAIDQELEKELEVV